MRTITALLTSALVLPALSLTTAPASAAAPQAAAAPAVKEVRADYGARRVRLEPRQGVDIAFRARAGDRVMLDLRSTESRYAPCFGTQRLRDGRGSRSAKIDGRGSAYVMTVRTTGRAVLGFRGYCSANKGQQPLAAAAQLTKVRLREVGREDRRTVRAPRRGFLDVAYVKVRRDGRDTMTLRTADGTTPEVYETGRVLQGSRIVFNDQGPSLSVEAGHRLAVGGSTYGSRGKLRPGQRIGFVVPARGHAESLQAREYSTALDAPATTLVAEPGREHVLVYAATDADRPYVTAPGVVEYVGDVDDPRWQPWRIYSGGADRSDPSLRRTIVVSDPNGADPQQHEVRVRRTVRVGELVVGGPPVTFASSEPGTRFVASIPETDAGTVRLTSSDVAVTGLWGTDIPPTVCYRDCLYNGLDVGTDKPVADGQLQPGHVHELQFTFGARTSGTVTLQLTDRP